ncbi:MAG: UDP-glucose 4-epimerase GalE [Chloroflexota bacterium]
MRVLVTGGAGYVGSVTVERLVAEGHSVTVLDSLMRGHRAAVPAEARLVEGDLADRQLVEGMLRDDSIEAVLHCAGRSLAPESVADPAIYFDTNVVAGLALLDAMRATGVSRIAFSSSAAVYGVAESAVIEEDHPLRPINAYGETKRAFEGALDWYARAYDMAAVSLRYFNAAGASEERGEDHRPETHLIPNMLLAALGGEPLKIFGTDYDTADGTCMRDYIHVLDLADAHISALEMTADVSATHIACNLGSGSGFSVLEMLRAAEAVVDREVPHSFGPRRPGDPAVLVASNAKARELLGWQPRRGTLDEMIGSAWRWHQAHPGGYDE